MSDKPAARTATEEALFWSSVKDAVTKRYTEARARAQEEMDRAGSVHQRIKGPDADFGKVTIAEGKWVPEIDEDTLLAWIQDNRPDEYYQTAPQLRIRESFLTALGNEAVQRAAVGEVGRATDEAGNPIPGVRAVWREGGMTVSATHAAKRRAALFLEALAPAADPAVAAPARPAVEPAPARVVEDAVVVEGVDFAAPAPF